MDYAAEKKAFVDAGHAIISEGLAAAHAAGDANPKTPLKTVVMSLEQTLRGMFSHLMSIGEDAAEAGASAALAKLKEDAADVGDAGAPPPPAKPLDPEVVGTAPAKDPTLKVQG